MKKTLIALAAVAATGAFAQSSVQLFGTLDASVVSLNNVGAASDKNTLAYADGAVSSSIWGMRGSEDLGGGLKANFELIGDIQTNNGGLNQNGIFRRAANVGIAGNFGSVDFGIKTNPLIASNGLLMPLAGNSVSTLTASAMGYADFFTKNAITYTSPNLSGFTAQIQYGMANNVTGSATDGSVTAWSLAYVNGPLAVRAAGQDRKDSGVASSANADTAFAKDSSHLGVSYNFGSFTLAAAALSNKAATVIGGTKVTYSGTQVGASYAATSAVTLGLNVTNSEGSVLTNAQARYALSKRTTVYAQYGLASNSKDNRVNFLPYATNTGTSPAGDITGYTAGVADKSHSALGLGVIHSF